MIHQLSWKTLPRLQGISCSDFVATPTDAPDQERGVALEFSDNLERDIFLRHLEEVFSKQRFSNNAAAFEAVKACVLEWAAKRS